MSFLETLNPQQKEAVVHTDGPLLILAGAGSGKTRVIICRIAYLIQNKGVPPYSILAVTFTNKAADEMRSRVAKLLAESGRAADLDARPSRPFTPSACGCCAATASLWPSCAAGFTKRFSIYDDKDQLQVIKSVYKHLGLDEKFMKARSAQSIISQAKNQGRTPQDFYKTATGPDGRTHGGGVRPLPGRAAIGQRARFRRPAARRRAPAAAQRSRPRVGQPALPAT